jgi:tetratricopeptide (TPR) repeat protein
MAQNIIAETNNLRVIEQFSGSNTVFVTFNESGTVVDGTRFWGDSFFSKHGISAIGIVTTKPNWYPRVDARIAIEAIRKAVGKRRIVTYGFSQGGYGALKFSAALGASAALGFSPQWSINPADVADFDNRYSSHFNEDLSNGLKIENGDLCACNYVFYDPYQKQDAAHAGKILGLGKTSAILMPFAADGTIRQVTESKAAFGVLSKFLESDEGDTKDIRKTLRINRRSSKTYISGMVDALLKIANRRTRTLRKVVGFLDEKHDLVALLKIAVAHRDRAGTERLMSVVSDKELTMNFWVLWPKFRKYKVISGEIRLAGLLPAAFPENTFIRIHGVDTYLQANLLEDAKRELSDIVRKLDVATCISQVLKFCLQLKAFEILEQAAQSLRGARSVSITERIEIGFRIVDTFLDARERGRAFRHLVTLLELSPDFPAVRRRISDYMFRLREWTFCYEIRAELARANPNDAAAALALIEAQAPLSREQAASKLQAFENRPGISASQWINISEIYEKTEDFKRAIAAVREALSLGASEEESQFAIARLCVRSGNKRQARKEFLRLSKIDNITQHHLLQAADISRSINDLSIALEFSTRLHKSAPDNLDFLLSLCDLRLVVCQKDALKDLIPELVRRVEESKRIKEEILVRAAALLSNLGRYDEELAVLDHALGLYPNSEALAGALLVNKYNPRNTSKKDNVRLPFVGKLMSILSGR